MSIYSEIGRDLDTEQSVDLHIKSNDRIGLLSEIFAVFSELEIAIVGHRAKVYTADNGKKYSQLSAKIEPISGNKVDTLVHRLNKVKGVIGVEACNAQ